MRYSFLIVAMVFNIGFILAQNPGNRPMTPSQPSIVGHITGKVLDSISRQSVEFAIVELLNPSDKQVNGSLTDENGNFTISDVKTGKYKLKISFMGYNPKFIFGVVTTLKDPDLDVKDILLEPNSVLLSEVQIVDQRSVVESQVDRLVYNVNSDPTLVGGDATDVLRKVPMLTVDMDGNVSLRGSQKVRILLNGKPSGLFAEDVGEALQMFPADEIQKVEVITSPGAKYDAEGTAGIINIITKKSILEGISGSVRGFFGNQMEHGNARLAYGHGRFGINARIGMRYKLPAKSSVDFFRESISDDGSVFTLSQNGYTDVSRNGLHGNIGAYYDLNAFNSFNTNVRLRGFQYSNDGEQNSVFSNSALDYNRISENIKTNKTIDWSTDYTRKFASNDEKKLVIAFQLETDLSNTENNKSIDTQLYDEANLNDGTNREITTQFDFVQPVSKKWKIELGGKAILRKLTSDFSREFIYDDHTTVDGDNTDIFYYNQNVFAGYLSMTFQLPKQISLMPGLRYEATNIEGDFKFYDSEFSNAYNNLFPSISVNKKFKDFSNIRVSYDSRISRPSLQYINPFVDNTDPLNVTFGNPEISPELTDNYEIAYSKFLKGATINLSVYYKNTRDVIESYLYVDDEYVSNTTYYNIGTTNALGFNVFSSLTLLKIWQLRGNFNINKYTINSVNLDEDTKNEGYRYNAFLSTSLNLKKGWQAEIWGFFNSPDYTLQGKNPSFSMYSFGIQKDIFNKKAKIGLRIVHPFSKNKVFLTELSGDDFSQTNKVTVPFRSIGISFNYNFGKLNFKERKDVINNMDQKINDDSQQMQEN
ncbi:MAG: TonB-dependent receptor [Saprospiraceae bacterium]